MKVKTEREREKKKVRAGKEKGKAKYEPSLEKGLKKKVNGTSYSWIQKGQDFKIRSAYYHTRDEDKESWYQRTECEKRHCFFYEETGDQVDL